MPAHRFHGGLQLEKHTTGVLARPIQIAAPSVVLALALQQHRGLRLSASVRVGESVAAGQVLARPDLDIGDPRWGAWLHAPCAGEVIGIETRPLIQQPTQSGLHILLRVDGIDSVQAAPFDWQNMTREAVQACLARAGISGLGGANFPSADKLRVAVETLILNGAECEPWIGCDDGLLIEESADVLLGAQILARASGALRIDIALEAHMTRALAALQAALDEVPMPDAVPMRLHRLPSRYPQGGERQLIEVLTGLQVPLGQHPTDIGVLVHDVGTAPATACAAPGRALTHRSVTVTGPGVHAPGNFRVALGTSVADLVAQAGGYTARARRLLIGGPLMGIALPHDDFALQKGSNCVLVLDGVLDLVAEPSHACIRCGDCAEVCPARLSPQLLWQSTQSQRLDQARENGLMACIECGLCDLVCPSHIGLTQSFREEKQALWLADHRARQADDARQRFEQRALRLQREAAALEARRASAGKEALSASVVALAIAKAKARRIARPGEDGGESAP